MKLIYLAHPFGGEQSNVDKVEAIIKELLHKHPDHSFYSPLHATGFLYSQLTYLDGMEHCFEELSRCDELWICGDWQDSRGCNMEYGYAKALWVLDWQSRLKINGTQSMNSINHYVIMVLN